MKKVKLEAQSLQEVAQEWGIDYQVFRIKSELVDTLRDYCQEHGIGQRKLTSMVPGLTKVRVSKIFAGQMGHITIDKLIEILSLLNFKMVLMAKAKPVTNT